MATLFRRSAQLARLQASALESLPRSARPIQRFPAAKRLPRQLYASSRCYSSHHKNGDKDAQQSGKAPAGKDTKHQKAETSPIEHDSAKHPHKADDGVSSQPPNDSSKANAQEEGKPDTEFAKLTKSEEEAIDKAFALISRGLPKKQLKEWSEAVKSLKEDGIPKHLRKTLDDVAQGKPVNLRTITKFTIDLAKYRAERTGKGAASQKTTKDPGPDGKKDGESEDGQQQKQGWGKNGSKMRIDVIRMDLGTMLVSTFITWLLYRSIFPGEISKDITWQEFRTTFLEKGLVERIVIVNQKRARVYLHREALASIYPDSPAKDANFNYYFTIGSVEAFERRLEQAQNELGIPNHERIPVAYKDEFQWFDSFISFLPLLFVFGILPYIMRRASGGGGGSGGIFGMGRSRAKKFNHETDVKVKFSDVAGMDEAKQEIMEFVSFLKEPGMYQKLGAKIPRGAILSGPPGTGKTLLAKATAGESEVPFFSVSGSEFVEMFVGVGASRVRDLFAEARKNTPCIVFIDEIDAIGKSRGKQQFGGGNDEREATLNQILTEMDGFNTSEQVVVLAGTNRPDVLDQALMRPGRFDRHISIDKPTMDGRKQIFAVHLRKIVTNEDMKYLQGRLSAMTPGFSGADIANCVNEAALIAARGKSESVTMAHFEQAIERVIGGLEKRSLVLSPEEKKTVAYHEAGHAICGWFLKYAPPLLKVSIIPRGNAALGYAQYLPPGDSYLMTVNQLMDRMAMTLGGRVSEELHFETVTSGASDDFKQVTRMATAMVTKWGMSDKIGHLYYEDTDGTQGSFQKPFSEETSRNIDSEVRRIVNGAYEKCTQLLTEKKAQVGQIAEELLSKEMLTRDDMVRILGKRPWEEKEEFSKYFDGTGGKGGLAEAPGGGGSIPPPLAEPPAMGGSSAVPPKDPRVDPPAPVA